LGWTCFSGLSDRREVPPLRRSPRCGIPTREKRLAVFHLLLGVTSERDLQAFTPCRFSGFWFGLGFAPPPDKGEAGRGYCRKFSGLDEHGAGFTPSPLRGEGRDEEWFKFVQCNQPHTQSQPSPPERGRSQNFYFMPNPHWFSYRPAAPRTHTSPEAPSLPLHTAGWRLPAVGR